jgi:hypothetical protein
MLKGNWKHHHKLRNENAGALKLLYCCSAYFRAPHKSTCADDAYRNAWWCSKKLGNMLNHVLWLVFTSADVIG